MSAEILSPDPPQATRADRRALHGGLILVLLAIPMVVPAFAIWPWHILAPLLAYGVIVALVPALRRSAHWLSFGQLDLRVLLVTAGIIVTASAALVLYAFLFDPDLSHLRRHLPAWTAQNLVLAGTVFVIVNATMEEVLFRGIVMDALESQLTPLLALLAQALAFGAGHYHGFPSGNVGMLLAGTYGLMLGLLRTFAGGLAAPVIAHIAADATIFMILMSGSSD